MEAKDAEVKELLEKKDLELEEMKKRLKDQERERQSELLKLQMEVNAKLHFICDCDALIGHWYEYISCDIMILTKCVIDYTIACLTEHDVFMQSLCFGFN